MPFRMLRAPLLSVALTAIAAHLPAAQPANEVVASALSLEFHSAFWLNLHHVLYADAWARRNVPPLRSLAGALKKPLKGDLAPGERAAWERAVAYYDRELAAKDLLFDDAMSRIRLSMIDASGSSAPAELTAEHQDVLNAAAPVYRKYWWPDHDRVNRAWIAAVLPRVQSLAPAVPDRIAALYGTPWFTTPVRVDVVYVANRQGAYTQLNPRPAHVTISSSDPEHQDWMGAEVLFHETSHALVRPITEAFTREARAAGKDLGVMWHVALFYLTGEVVRQTLESRGISYSPYLYKTGLFERAWPQYKTAIETEWSRYVHGDATLDDAVKKTVAAYQPPR
jgi:hypothetical protein